MDWRTYIEFLEIDTSDYIIVGSLMSTKQLEDIITFADDSENFGNTQNC